MNVRVTITDLDTGKVMMERDSDFVIIGMAKTWGSQLESNVFNVGETSYRCVAGMITHLKRVLERMVEEDKKLQASIVIVSIEEEKEENEK